MSKQRISSHSLKPYLNKTFYDNHNNIVFSIKIQNNIIKIPNIDLNTKEYSEIITTLKYLEINGDRIILKDYDLEKIKEKKVEEIFFEVHDSKEKMKQFLDKILRANVYFEKIIIYYRNAKIETKRYQQVYSNYLKFKNKLLTLYRSIYLIKIYYPKKEDVIKYIPNIRIDTDNLPTMILVL